MLSLQEYPCASEWLHAGVYARVHPCRLFAFCRFAAITIAHAHYRATHNT